jgi:hypothetical protein
MKQTLFIGLLFFSCYLSAQTIINGNVKNTEGNPVIATITVQSKGSLVISGYTSTNDDGIYSVTYKGNADSIVITVSGINIGKHKKTVVNRSAKLDFSINEKPLELKEATVSASKITQRGDTLNYNVASYADQNDRVIGDVLQKMPGIDVDLNGKITYNGKGINKFYIENLDLLQGRYGLATSNIAAKDVATVQVLENHQPIKALKDKVFSDAAAINLKLKDSAKGTASLNGAVGLGYEPLLWKAELILMYFTGKKQNMSTYKGNNSGDDVASELRTHYDYERVVMNSGGILSVQSPSTPPVPQKRYLQNNTHTASINHLFKLNNDMQLNVSALYHNDYIKKESYSLYEQYLSGDSTLVIEEQINSASKINNAEIALSLENNANNIYLRNRLNFKGSWNGDNAVGKTFSNALNTTESISQYLDKPVFSFDNTFSLVKNVKYNFYNIYFSVGYGYKPHSLNINPVNYFDRNDLSAVTQEAVSRDMATVLRFSYGLKLGNFTLDYAVWGRADIRNLNTELKYITNNNIAETADSLKNNLYYNTYQTGIYQTYSYKINKFRATATIPVGYYLLAIDDRIPNKSEHNSKLMFNPSLSLGYNITNNVTIGAQAKMEKSFGDMNSSYTAYIMHSYRSLLRNSIDKLFESDNKNISTSVSYRNPFKSLFLNVTVGYNRSQKNLLYGYSYQGIMSMKTVINQPTKSDGYQISFSGSKGLSIFSGTIRVHGGYGENKNELLIQNEVLNYRSQQYNAGGSINVNPFSFASVNYSLAWNKNKNYTVERPERFPAITSTSQKVEIGIYPVKTLTINAKIEHSYNSAATNRYTSFADAGIKFKSKKYDIEFELNNILNSKQYISASYNDISTYYYSYNLRPRSAMIKIRFKLM